MSLSGDYAGQWLYGPLLRDSGGLPLSLHVLVCDLRPRFLPKGQVGSGYRAVARNGRVLLALDRPLNEMAGVEAGGRLQVWHRALLPGDRPKPYGLIFCLRRETPGENEPVFQTRLVPCCAETFALGLEVGGGLVLEFRRD
jgi:hypothetical protein